MVKPFFVTPYPGCEWYSVYKDKILDQYDGDLESFVCELGDATDITASISENFDAVELYGLRELMMRGDFRKLAKFEEEWRRLKGDPKAGVDRAAARANNKVAVHAVAAE